MMRTPSFFVFFFTAACTSDANPVITDASTADTSVSDTSLVDMGSDTAQTCTAAIAQVLKPVAKVSAGAVTVLNTFSDGTGMSSLVSIDATAGGFGAADMNPRVYVDLAASSRVDITDKQAPTSTSWDLAFKRNVIFSNSGTDGNGGGGTRVIAKPFESVTAADATGAFAVEACVDANCNPKTDQVGGPLTTLSDWYDYNQQTNAVTAKANTTYVVRGGSGKLYRFAVVDYYGLADGGVGTSGASANYIVKAGAL